MTPPTEFLNRIRLRDRFRRRSPRLSAANQARGLTDYREGASTIFGGEGRDLAFLRRLDINPLGNC